MYYYTWIYLLLVCAQCNRTTWVHTFTTATYSATVHCWNEFYIKIACTLLEWFVCWPATDDRNGIHKLKLCASRHKAHLNFRLNLFLTNNVIILFYMGHHCHTILLPRTSTQFNFIRWLLSAITYVNSPFTVKTNNLHIIIVQSIFGVECDAPLCSFKTSLFRCDSFFAHILSF